MELRHRAYRRYTLPQHTHSNVSERPNLPGPTKMKPPPRRPWLESIHLFGLWGFAAAQPLYALLVANPQFLAAHRVGPFEMAVLVSVLSFLAPAGLPLGGLLLEKPAPAWRDALHAGLVATLVGFVGIQVVARLLPRSGLLCLLLGVVGSVGFTLLYRRWEGLRAFTTYASLAALLFPLIFLFDGRVREFLRPPSPPAFADIRVGARHPVVLLVFDELPLGALLDEDLEIDAEWFPNFARLGSRSHWFRGATTVGSYTDLAIPALLTGRRPPTEGLVPATLAHHPENLFTLLGGSYEIFEHQIATNLVPASAMTSSAPAAGVASLLTDLSAVALHVVSPPAWRVHLPSLQGWADFWGVDLDPPAETTPSGDVVRPGRGRGRLDRLREFLGSLENTERPPLLYIHSLSPHVPWEHLPSGRRYFDSFQTPGLEQGTTWADDPWLVDQAYQRFIAQLIAVDALLGDVLARLGELGWLEGSVMVVTADHGATFTASRSRRDLGAESAQLIASSIAPVPLFLKLPGQQEGVIDDGGVELIDIMPTLAELLEVELPWPADGVSLFGADAGARAGKRIQLRDPYVEIELPDASGALREWVDGARARFGRGPHGEIDLFRLGPHGDLVGTSVENAVDSESELTVTLHRSNLFRNVDPTAPRLPAWIHGELDAPDGSEAEPIALAVAVNGVIRAATRTSVQAGTPHFHALVPESSFVAGENRVEVFRIVGSGDGRFLQRLEVRGLQQRLQDQFETSGSVVLVAGGAHGWSGFEGANDTQLRTTPEGRLEIVAPGAVPILETPEIVASSPTGLVVAIDLEVTDDITPVVRYQTESDPAFRPFRYVRSIAASGRGRVLFKIDEPDVRGPLLIDLGRIDHLTIHSFEVRAAEGSGAAP